ncbi:helix-turn-helix transcriptional regulator [Corynebacterium bovis]|uniref:helix-turn-helix transcriptional regulator n=1 Tax=Corynebacterium bovis TaxID=36808 RepID=UPI003CC722E8
MRSTGLETWRSDLLRYDRYSRSFSQVQLAEHLGFSPETIRKWETGRAAPGPASYLKICKFFGRDRWHYSPLEEDLRTLHSYRVRNGLRIKDLSAELKLSSEVVKAVEAAKRNVGERVVRQWSSLISVTPELWHSLQSRGCSQRVLAPIPSSDIISIWQLE